jgi:hypothetical protein
MIIIIKKQNDKIGRGGYREENDERTNIIKENGESMIKPGKRRKRKTGILPDILGIKQLRRMM